MHQAAPRADIVWETCYKCSLPIALTAEHYRRAREDGESFCCPAGHSQVYRTTDKQKLKRRIKSLEGQLEREKNYSHAANRRADRLERSRNAMKGVVTRTKNRAASGKCPHCTKVFEDLAQHCAAEHGDE
jgi:hypothetical protein